MSRSFTVICISAFVSAVLAGPVASGPSATELKSYRCVVPEWSKTSGVRSYAISPDGRCLAYRGYGKVGDGWEEQIWILPDVDWTTHPEGHYVVTPSDLDPYSWQLIPEYSDREVVAESWGDGSEPSKTIDWSPDGKRLAFVLKGRLFVAESSTSGANFKYHGPVSPPKIKLLCDYVPGPDKQIEGKMAKTALAIREVWWSPDSKKISFMRAHADTWRNADLCVVYLDSGKCVTLAKDVHIDRYDPLQPWSRDSESLLYRPISNSDYWSHKIVRLDGGPERTFNHGVWATFSPTEDKVMVSGNQICVCNVSDIRSTSQDIHWAMTPNGPSAVLTDNEVEARYRKMALEKYGDSLSEKLKSMLEELPRGEIVGRLTLQLMIAKKIAPYLSQKLQDQIREADIALAKGDSQPTNMLVSKFYGLQSEDAGRMFVHEWLGVEYSVNPEGQVGHGQAVWSPDGKKIAYVRSGGELRLLDPATGEDRLLLTTDQITDLSWANGGKVIACACQRNICGVYTENVPKGSVHYRQPSWDERASYCEVWIVEPREKPAK